MPLTDHDSKELYGKQIEEYDRSFEVDILIFFQVTTTAFDQNASELSEPGLLIFDIHQPSDTSLKDRELKPK